MKIGIIQQDIIWKDPQSNHSRLEHLLEPLQGCDLVVLPEMFSTGYVIDPEGVAESRGESLSWMKRTAIKGNYAIAGSIASYEDGHYYNRLHFVTPQGTVTTYDKHHLFTFAGEYLHYTPGTEKVIVNYAGVRILLQICYDLRFPIFSRNHPEGEDTYDLVIYVASWPEQRSDAWKTLLKARAIENQCFVVGVNRCGSDPKNSYSGDSMILDWKGCSLVSCTPYKEEAAFAQLDLQALKAARESFPVLCDRD